MVAWTGSEMNFEGEAEAEVACILTEVQAVILARSGKARLCGRSLEVSNGSCGEAGG